MIGALVRNVAATICVKGHSKKSLLITRVECFLSSKRPDVFNGKTQKKNVDQKLFSCAPCFIHEEHKN